MRRYSPQARGLAARDGIETASTISVSAFVEARRYRAVQSAGMNPADRPKPMAIAITLRTKSATRTNARTIFLAASTLLQLQCILWCPGRKMSMLLTSPMKPATKTGEAWGARRRTDSRINTTKPCDLTDVIGHDRYSPRFMTKMMPVTRCGTFIRPCAMLLMLGLTLALFDVQLRTCRPSAAERHSRLAK